jgi:hypothetical protein
MSFGQQVSGTNADRRKTIAGWPGVGGVLPLRQEMQQRCSLDIGQGAFIELTRHLVETIEKERLEVLDCLMPGQMSGMMQHLVQMLRRTVVPGMFWIPETIGVSVQRTRTGYRLITLAAIDDVHEMGFYPSLDDLTVLGEADEFVAGFEEVVDELVDCQFALVPEHARMAAVFEALEQPGQYPIHLDRLEVEITDLGQAKLAILLL